MYFQYKGMYAGWQQIPESIVISILSSEFKTVTPALFSMVRDGDEVSTSKGLLKWVDKQSTPAPIFKKILDDFTEIYKAGLP